MVVIDATMLLLILHPDTPGPTDDEGNPLLATRERIDYLIAETHKKRDKVVIPTPALAEVLVRIGKRKAVDIVTALNNKAVFVIEPFDQRAAIETALMLRKKPKSEGATYAKVKFDRQIVATAKVCGASAIYSDDGDIHTLGEAAGIPVYRVRDLPIPASAAQWDLFKPDTDADDEDLERNEPE